MQNPKLRDALLATGNSLLIEGNTWGDYFWGKVNGHGENQLGLILMDVREKLKWSMGMEMRLHNEVNELWRKETDGLDAEIHRHR